MNEILLKRYSKNFNMKKICDQADVNYQVYKNWAYNHKYLSQEKIDKLLDTMSSISEQIKEERIMNEIVKKAIEIQNKGEFKGDYIPELEVGEECEMNDLWDGRGECPTESYSYKLTDSGENGEDNMPVWINYVFEVIEEKENELDTIIKIVKIELI